MEARRIIMTCLLLALGFALAGCVNINTPKPAEDVSKVVTVYVRPGDPVRLREDVRAKVWVKRDGGEWVATEMILQNGWFVLSGPYQGEGEK